MDYSIPIRRFARLQNEENKKLAYNYWYETDWDNLTKEFKEEVCVLLARQEYDRNYKRDRARLNPDKVNLTRPRTGTKYDKIQPETKDDIINKFNNGSSMNEIAKELELSIYMIKKVIEEAKN